MKEARTKTKLGYRRRPWGAFARTVPFPVNSREYKAAWARLNRARVRRAWQRNEKKRMQRMDYRRQKADASKRWRARHPEKVRAYNLKWNAVNHKARRKLNREYRIEHQGMVCYLCGYAGSQEHPLRRIERAVAGHRWETQRVLACHRCRPTRTERRRERRLAHQAKRCCVCGQAGTAAHPVRIRSHHGRYACYEHRCVKIKMAGQSENRPAVSGFPTPAPTQQREAIAPGKF